MRQEGLARESVLDMIVIGQFSQSGGPSCRNGDVSYRAGPLKMVNRGQDLVVGDHTAADDGYIQGDFPRLVESSNIQLADIRPQLAAVVRAAPSVVRRRLSDVDCPTGKQVLSEDT